MISKVALPWLSITCDRPGLICHPWKLFVFYRYIILHLLSNHDVTTRRKLLILFQTMPSKHIVQYQIFVLVKHDDVIKWKLFSRCWPFVRGFHRSPVNSPHKGPVMRTFDVGPHMLSNKQSNDWWFKTPWPSCDVVVMRTDAWLYRFGWGCIASYWGVLGWVELWVITCPCFYGIHLTLVNTVSELFSHTYYLHLP